MKAIINGVEYEIRVADFSDTTGRQDPGITNTYTVMRDIWDEVGIGVLNDLGINFGYRLIIKGNRGKQNVTELTKDQVQIIRDNA